MDRDELQKLRDEASATIARIDRALASMTEKPTPERPFRRGEPVLVYNDEKCKFMGFFVELRNNRFVVSENMDLLYPTRMNTSLWLHCEHLPPFIDWSLINSFYRYAVRYDSGIVSVWADSPQIGVKDSYGTTIAVQKRSKENAWNYGRRPLYK